ncbi:ketimine reductase mu-crystallin isoform X2 [Lycorma delicatula]
MCSPLYITDDQVKKLLDWNTVITAVEDAFRDVSTDSVIQPPRLLMQIPPKNGVFLALPAFSQTKDALACKLVTSFENNPLKGLPTVLGIILYFDPDTGKIKAIIEATEITLMRTAAASVVATKYLHHGKKNVLTIVGAGQQGRSHALAMKHYFNFQQVRIWNRTPERAKKLCEELGSWAVHYNNLEESIRGADVIVTVTHNPSSPLVMLDWVKEGAHINAVGSGETHYKELAMELYKYNGTTLFVDHMPSASKELKGLVDSGVKLEGEVGQIIGKVIDIPPKTKITVFQSLGMAIEDVLSAKVVYDAYIRSQNTTVQ